MNRREFLKLLGIVPLISVIPKIEIPEQIKQEIIPTSLPEDVEGILYVQNSKAPLLYAPDKNGYYWGMSGTSKYPIYQLGYFDYVTLINNSYENYINNIMDIQFTILNSPYPHLMYEQIHKENYFHLQFHTKTYTMYFHKAIMYSIDTEDIFSKKYFLNYRCYPTEYGTGTLIKGGLHG